jgi:DNA polymerase I
MKFFLFDAMSLVFRAYHAMAKMNLQAPNGELTGAVYGFANILSTILSKEKPDYIGIAFDTPAPTFRHEKFAKYKAHRPEFPKELVPQLARIKEMIALLNITQIEMPGFEADDVIGTLTTRFGTTENLDVYCITSDKDYCQLVNEHVKLFRPGFSMGEYDIVDIAGVHAKFGVTPEQVIDVLALIGDASDNVPGVKGIGEKTAIPLVQQYGSLENIYQNLDALKDSVRTKLENDRDIAFLSKELVTLDTNVPFESTLEQFARREIQTDVLKEFFLELGFRTMFGKFFVPAAVPEDEALSFPPASLQTLRDIEHEYLTADTPEKIRSMVQELQSARMLAFDTETTSLDTMTSNLVGISLCAAEGRAFYVPISSFTTATDSVSTQTDSVSTQTDSVSTQEERTTKTAQGTMFDIAVEHVETSFLPANFMFPAELTPVKELLENQHVPKCGQNAKFDMLVLRRYGINVSPVGFDTMLASHIFNSEAQNGMDALAQKWLNYAPIPITALIGEKKKEQRSMAEVELERIAEYAAEDADITLRLYNILDDKLRGDKLLDFAARVEFPLVEVLTEMEYNGIAIDSGALGSISTLIRVQTTDLKRSIFAAAGREFSVDSPKQLSEILFGEMKIPPVKKTKTGNSTDSFVLEELAAEHPIAELVLEYRQLTKLQSTYVESLPKLVNPYTGRIHTTYNQTVAGTGRLSSTDPNLQNIPIRTELGREIRKAFIADTSNNPKMLLLSADYSQIELRIMAHICKDETLVHAFQNGLDVHAATASLLFSVDVEDVNRDMRRIAKTVNFGVMYGLGAFGLAQRLKISRSEGKTIIDNYFGKYPRIKEYIDSTMESTRKNGYAATLLGRRKYYPNINSPNRLNRTAAERAAINMPIQGTAAEMMKLAMIAVHNQMREQRIQSKMLLQIHDELVFEMHPDERDTLPALVKRCMEGAMSLGNVPVIVETGMGGNWAEAH